MYKLLRIISLIALIVVIAGISFFGGFFFGRTPSAYAMLPNTGSGANAAQQGGQPPDVDMINQAYEIIKRNYADRETLDQTNMTYSAISGMVDSLGDTGHSRFMTPEMVEQEKRTLSGEFDGIGALLQVKDGRPTILAPMDNSPALKAGLQPGDIILMVNGEDVSTKTLNEIVQRVIGPAGTQVEITILRPETDETLTFKITRARIVIKDVTWQMLPGTKIAHLRVANFSQNAGKDMIAALEDIQAQGAEGLILDLRNNPGGYLNTAETIVSQYLKTGNVMQEKNAEGRITNIPVKPGGIATDIPMVVLINEGSASAAEITSGALQDYGRAKLIGTTTFGTGTVLLSFPLQDGSALLLATEQWLTPKGRVIWHKGIEPDIEVKLGSDVSLLIPETERGMTAEQLKASKDAQLLRALEEVQKLTGK